MAFKSLEQLTQSFFKVIKSVACLFRLEFLLARRAVIPYAFLCLSFMFLLFSVWVIILALIGYSIFLSTHNIFWVLSSVLLINVALLCVTAMLLSCFAKHLRFEQTRKYLRLLTKGNIHESQTTD